MRATAGITALLALAAAGLALLPAPAEARRGGGGGFGHARGFGAFHAHAGSAAAVRMTAAPIRIRPSAPAFRPGPPQRLAYLAPPVQPLSATYTPYRGAQVVRMPRAVPTWRYRSYGWGWGWGGVPAAVPGPAPVAPPVAMVVADPGLLTGATPTGTCPPPPPEMWIGGRLWIPDHQACDGRIVPGRWGAESPFGLARN